MIAPTAVKPLKAVPREGGENRETAARLQNWAKNREARKHRLGSKNLGWKLNNE